MNMRLSLPCRDSRRFSTIPLVQGLLKYIYEADPEVNNGVCSGSVCTYDEAWAEGWAFAAAVLPRLNKCDAKVAQLVRENLDVDGAEKPLKDGYRALKAQIETTYSCLGITCAAVGVYQDSDGVFAGMEACENLSPPTSRSRKTTRTDHTPIIVLISVTALILIVVIALAVQLVFRREQKTFNYTFRHDKTKNTLFTTEFKDDASETTASDITNLEIDEVDIEKK